MKVQSGVDADFWPRHIAQYRKSGLTQPEYCKRHGITLNQLVARHGRGVGPGVQ